MTDDTLNERQTIEFANHQVNSVAGGMTVAQQRSVTRCSDMDMADWSLCFTRTEDAFGDKTGMDVFVEA